MEGKRKLDEVDGKKDNQPQAPVVTGSGGEVVGKDDLRVYYDRLFPVSLFFQWLSHSDSNETIIKREFSFTLEGDIYVRYISFKTKEEFKAALLKKVPFKIDIGAVFNAPPDQHESIPNFKPIEKELVVDIDMTDYDDVRTCCTGANICQKCWVLMTTAMKVVDRGLRDDFGFKRLLWVYSGRRGIHCWVCDKGARELSNDARTAVINYMSIFFTGTEGNRKAEVTVPLHYSLSLAYNTCLAYFEQESKDGSRKSIIEDQGLFEDHESCDKILRSMGLEEDEEFKQIFQAGESGLERWAKLKSKVAKRLASGKRGKGSSISTALEACVFTHCFPRLDVNVSKQMNHLLKAPFCVHPKTGRVCVPIDPDKADEFNPLAVPTLQQLHDELNAENSTTKGWQGSSLEPCVLYFQNFVKQLQSDYRTQAKADKLEEIDSGVHVDIMEF